MKTQIYNYRSGEQIIPEDVFETVINTIEGIDYVLNTRSIREFNKDVMLKLKAYGWSDNYALSVYSKISITALYDKIGLCIQTGNVARIYADVLKLQTLFTEGKINAGIIVLPTKSCADTIGKNVANYERLYRELMYIFLKVITIPMLIVSFYSE